MDLDKHTHTLPFSTTHKHKNSPLSHTCVNETNMQITFGTDSPPAQGAEQSERTTDQV